MEKLELGEGCFGPDVAVDGVSLEHLDQHHDAERTLLINQKRKELISELLKVSDKIDTYSLYELAKILVNTVPNKFEIVSSSSDTCDQCGSWNSDCEYKFIEDDKN